VNASLAALINRPDVAAMGSAQTPQDLYTGYAAADTGGISMNAGVDTGRLSALALAGLTAGFLLFYVWTRGSQK